MNTWTKMGVVFAALAGLIALFEWIDPSKDLKLAAQAFISGMMAVGLPAIWLWDLPFRQEKLARERKKLGLVQAIPRRQDRLNELDDHIVTAETGIKKSEIFARHNLQEAQEYAHLGGSWEAEYRAAAVEWAGNAKMGEANLKKFRQERDRIAKLTDDEWRAEQEAKIYVPD